MYLDKVLINHPNICIVPKKELVCVFSFLGKKSLEIKKRLQNAIEITLPHCKLKVIFKSPSKIVNHFRFKNVLPKKLCSGHLLQQNNDIDCNINFNDFIILSKDYNNFSLLIKESLIVRDKPILTLSHWSYLNRQNLIVNVLIVLFNKNVCNILNVTVMIMP